MSEAKTITDRMENVLHITFRGLHHCPKIHKYRVGSPYERWEVNYWSYVSTYDYDQLTRLVVSAHDECIRVAIKNSGPGMIKIQLWARKRGGSMTERHPTIEEAIKAIRE